MEQLWKTRKQQYHKMLLKYLKYVFNDHFVLAMLFILGGLSLGYGNFLKHLSLHAHLQGTVWVFLLFYLLLLHVGRPILLIKPADQAFLLPKTGEMRQYLHLSLQYTLQKVLTLQVIVLLITVPYLRLALHFSWWAVSLLFIYQIGLKVVLLKQQYSTLQQNNSVTMKQLLINWLVPLIGYLAFVKPTFAWFSLIVLVSLIVFTWQKGQVDSWLNWPLLVQSEKQRMLNVWRFFALFTEVPALETKAKRRAYLDWLLPKTKQPYRFLYGRGFLRNSDYSNLCARLTVLGIIILCFIQQWYFALGLALVFNYLILFQLLPFINYYQNIVFIHLYPQTAKTQQKSFQQLLFKIATGTSILFALASLVGTHSFKDTLMILVALLIEAFFVQKTYLHKIFNAS